MTYFDPFGLYAALSLGLLFLTALVCVYLETRPDDEEGPDDYPIRPWAPRPSGLRRGPVRKPERRAGRRRARSKTPVA
jgi:hypothetical protein